MNCTTQTFRSHWLLVFLCFVVFSFLLSLGFWQLKRLAWKEDLLATIDSRINSTPVPFDEVLEKFEIDEDVEYIPVIVYGSFLHSGEKHYYATHNGVPGWFVFTPFHFDNAQTVFINRGFVPTTLKAATLREESLIEGEVEVIGLVRIPPKEKPNIFTPENQPDKNEFYWRDLRAMAESVEIPKDHNIIPLFIDAGPNQNVAFPIGGTTLINLPNNHLHYALTWFGLAIVLVVISSRLLWKNLKRY